jgi:hypothetical protein
MRRLIYLFLTILLSASATASDSIPSGFSRPLEWRIGAEVAPAYVPGTNRFLEGINPLDKFVRNNLAASLRADFSFSPDSREGVLYPGLYQGIGVGMQSFFSQSLLGTPVTAYVYQGAPIASLSERLWLGYEWKFGAAFGWKHYHEENAPDNSVVSTNVTAMMALGFKLHYAISERCNLSFGVEGQHFSNGNTSWPNAGINSIGASIGIAYLLNPATQTSPTLPALEEEADHGRWLYDIVAYGAWRKREVFVGEPAEPELCPGKFAIAGLQFSPLRSLNRYVAVGPALDLQWDEGSGLSPYWVDGTTGDFLLFYRPPFGKQLSIGVSAHAELTMPIFSVNAGLGYDILSPVGNERFYQSLTLKTFVTRNIFLNVGYRLSNFKTPQNLMLGVGIRL